MKYLKKYYYAVGLARCHLFYLDLINDNKFRVGKKNNWYYIYHHKERVFDCNNVFFKAHFKVV